MRWLFVFLAAAAYAAAPAGSVLWKGADLKALENTLAGKMNAQKFASQQMGKFDGHSLVAIHRQGDGEAEVHDTQTDIFVVQSGKGTLVVGGKVVNGRLIGPGEIRGESIRGGERRELVPGDMVNIPARAPHQVLVEAGGRITYVIVKVDAK